MGDRAGESKTRVAINERSRLLKALTKSTDRRIGSFPEVEKVSRAH